MPPPRSDGLVAWDPSTMLRPVEELTLEALNWRPEAEPEKTSLQHPGVNAYGCCCYVTLQPDPTRFPLLWPSRSSGLLLASGRTSHPEAGEASRQARVWVLLLLCFKVRVAVCVVLSMGFVCRLWNPGLCGMETE